MNISPKKGNIFLFRLLVINMSYIMYKFELFKNRIGMMDEDDIIFTIPAFIINPIICISFGILLITMGNYDLTIVLVSWIVTLYILSTFFYTLLISNIDDIEEYIEYEREKYEQWKETGEIPEDNIVDEEYLFEDED